MEIRKAQRTVIEVSIEELLAKLGIPSPHKEIKSLTINAQGTDTVYITMWEGEFGT